MLVSTTVDQITVAPLFQLDQTDRNEISSTGQDGVLIV